MDAVRATFDPPDDVPGGVPVREPVEIVELQVRRVPEASTTATEARSLARSTGEAAMGLALLSARVGLGAGRLLYRRVATGAVGRMLAEIAAGALDALRRDTTVDWHLAERRAEEQLGRVIAVVVPVVVQSLDPQELIELVDVNAIIDAVDIDEMLGRVDIDHLLERVDVNGLLDRVDIDRLLARVDVAEFLADVDVQTLVDRVDVDTLMARVDVAAIAKRAQIGELVAESTSDVAGSALDLARRQAVGLDTLLARTVNRVLGRDPDGMPQGPPALSKEEETPS